MLSLISAEVKEAMGYLWEDDYVYAYHTGKAGGIAAAIGAQGFFCDSLCDDISDAYKQLDLAAGYDEDFDGFDKEQFEDLSDYIRDLDMPFWNITVLLDELPDGDTGDDNAVDTRIGWEEYGASLNDAVQAKEDGDELRYALMIGFVSGLMFRDPGPQYPEGSILDAITEGYEEGREERVQWAQARLAAAHRLSDPGPFMGKNAYDRYMKEKLQMMRWVQNFGLHNRDFPYLESPSSKGNPNEIVASPEGCLDVPMLLSTEEDDTMALEKRVYKHKKKQLEVIRTSPDSATVSLKCEKHDHEDIIVGMMEGERGWLIGRKKSDEGPRGPIDMFSASVEFGADKLVEECEAVVQLDEFFAEDERVYEYQGEQFELFRTSSDSATVNLKCGKHDHEGFNVAPGDGVEGWLVGRGNDPYGPSDKETGWRFAEAVEFGADKLVEECEAVVQLDEFFAVDVP